GRCPLSAVRGTKSCGVYAFIMPSELLAQVIDSIVSGKGTFFRYITANDVGTTGGHQVGFYYTRSGIVRAYCSSIIPDRV
ncbi:MAG: EcoRII N-terminal effector-binding domain-containing protein, partial [Bacteroides sp.]